MSQLPTNQQVRLENALASWFIGTVAGLVFDAVAKPKNMGWSLLVGVSTWWLFYEYLKSLKELPPPFDDENGLGVDSRDQAILYAERLGIHSLSEEHRETLRRIHDALSQNAYAIYRFRLPASTSEEERATIIGVLELYLSNMAASHLITYGFEDDPDRNVLVVAPASYWAVISGYVPSGYHE